MGTTTYDKLSRGRKQEIDLERRKKLKEAKDMPESRMGDTALDVMGSVLDLALPVKVPQVNARATYKAGRDKVIRKAQDKADYKDLKRKPTRLFRDKNVEGMSDDEIAKLGEFQVEKYKKGGKVRGAGIAKRGLGKGRMC